MFTVLGVGNHILLLRLLGEAERAQAVDTDNLVALDDMNWNVTWRLMGINV